MGAASVAVPSNLLEESHYDSLKKLLLRIKQVQKGTENFDVKIGKVSLNIYRDYLLGIYRKLSVKASLVDAQSGNCVSSAFYPKKEMPIEAKQAGWAEQDPNAWWENLKIVTREIMTESNVNPAEISAIGISYQMHGLVLVDKNRNLLRPAIIWCYSRAVPYGEESLQRNRRTKMPVAFAEFTGQFYPLPSWPGSRIMNRPFFDKIDKFHVAGRLHCFAFDGECLPLLSDCRRILWDFKENAPASFLMDYYGFSKSWIPEIRADFPLREN